MSPSESQKGQEMDSDSKAEAEQTPELPHPPHLPSPEPPGGVESDSPTSAGSAPEPHFDAPGRFDPPV
jgi:hypothetical protein